MTPKINLPDRSNELETRLEATKAQLRDLATMGAVITSIHDIDAVLSVVMDMAIRLVDGEVGLIMLEHSGQLKVEISWGVDEEIASLLKYQDDTDLAFHCFSSARPVVLNDLGIKSPTGLSIESAICLPIATADKCHGVLLIINKASGQPYNDEDREILEMLLHFVAVAIDNSLLLKHRLAQQKTAQEMAIARQVQYTILPQDIDSIPGAEIGAVYSPAREVGGDFYDILRLDESRYMIVIGDVSNKGVPAALVMSAASGIIGSLLAMQPEMAVADLVERLNDLLVTHIIKDREMFVTLFFGKLDLTKLRLTYCNAGHLPGLFWDADRRDIVELAIGGPLVGQFAGIPFNQGEQRLSSGDRLLLFTDGLTEAADANGNLFGRKRVEEVFVAGVDFSPATFCERLKLQVDEFARESAEENRDDFTLLQLKVL